MSIANDLRLSPAHADAAYLAISLVLMADGRVLDSGRAMLELAARELEIDRTAAEPHVDGPAARMSAPARAWLVDVLALAANIDGPPSRARQCAALGLARTFAVRSPWETRTAVSSRWRAAALRAALRHDGRAAAELLAARGRVAELGYVWHALRARLGPLRALARG